MGKDAAIVSVLARRCGTAAGVLLVLVFAGTFVECGRPFPGGTTRDGCAASALLHKPVKNHRGQHLAEVRDLVIDRDGRVRFGVLAVGGFWGFGAELIVVPWRALEVRRDGYSLDVSPNRLATAPRLAEMEGGRPALANPQWTREVERYFALAGINKQNAAGAGECP